MPLFVRAQRRKSRVFERGGQLWRTTRARVRDFSAAAARSGNRSVFEKRV